MSLIQPSSGSISDSTTYAARLHKYFEGSFFSNETSNRLSKINFSRSKAYMIILAVACAAAAAIVYTAHHPTEIVTKEQDPDNDKGHRIAGAVVSGIASIGVIIFMCLYVLSHTAGKGGIMKNAPLFATYTAKVFLLFFMWLAFYIIPIINYVKFGWQPLRDNPPQKSSEYKVYQVFRGIMNVILIIIGAYCTFKFFGYGGGTNQDDFIVAYVAVFMAMFGAAINLANMAGFASTDDVLLST